MYANWGSFSSKKRTRNHQMWQLKWLEGEREKKTSGLKSDGRKLHYCDISRCYMNSLQHNLVASTPFPDPLLLPTWWRCWCSWENASSLIWRKLFLARKTSKLLTISRLRHRMIQSREKLFSWHIRSAKKRYCDYDVKSARERENMFKWSGFDINFMSDALVQAIDAFWSLVVFWFIWRKFLWYTRVCLKLMIKSSSAEFLCGVLSASNILMERFNWWFREGIKSRWYPF